MAAAKMVSVRVPEDVLAAVDYAAEVEGVKRSVWMVRALESALGSACTERSQPAGQDRAGRRETAPVSASSRASGPTRIDTVADARVWAAERQAKLNAAKDRSS